MSGKVWSGLGAICLAIFSVAIEKNWGTLSAALTATSDFLSLSVTVPMYFMVLAALACIGGIVFLSFYLYEYLKDAPLESVDSLGGQTITTGSGRKRRVTLSAAAPVEQPPPKRTFSAGEIDVLSEFAKKGVTVISQSSLKEAMGKSAIQIEYSLDRLVEKDFVRLTDNMILGVAVVLTEEGKRFVVESGKQLEDGSWCFLV